MDQSLVSTSVSFICRLQYQISGQDAAILNLLKLPKGLSQTSKVILVASAIHALDHKNQLDSVISSARNSIASTEGSAVMDFLVALGELVSFRIELGRNV